MKPASLVTAGALALATAVLERSLPVVAGVRRRSARPATSMYTISDWDDDPAQLYGVDAGNADGNRDRQGRRRHLPGRRRRLAHTYTVAGGRLRPDYAPMPTSSSSWSTMTASDRLARVVARACSDLVDGRGRVHRSSSIAREFEDYSGDHRDRHPARMATPTQSADPRRTSAGARLARVRSR